MMFGGMFVFKCVKLVGRGCLQMMRSSYRPGLDWVSGNTKREIWSWWWKDRVEDNYNMIWWWSLSKRFQVFWKHRGRLNEFECKMRKKVRGKMSLMRMTSELALAEAEWRWCRKLHHMGATQRQVLLNMIPRAIVCSPAFYSSLIGTVLEVPQRVDPPEIRGLSLFYWFLFFRVKTFFYTALLVFL